MAERLECFAWWSVLLLPGHWQQIKMLLKNSESGAQVPVGLIQVEEAPQFINIRIKGQMRFPVAHNTGGKETIAFSHLQPHPLPRSPRLAARGGSWLGGERGSALPAF